MLPTHFPAPSTTRTRVSSRGMASKSRSRVFPSAGRADTETVSVSLGFITSRQSIAIPSLVRFSSLYRRDGTM